MYEYVPGAEVLDLVEQQPEIKPAQGQKRKRGEEEEEDSDWEEVEPEEEDEEEQVNTQYLTI